MGVENLGEMSVVALRLGGAVVMGGIIGIDRDLHRKPAGLRVMAMVALGSSLITMCAIWAANGPEKVAVDGTLHVVQGILAGIGFLGAGVILQNKTEEHVHGLTTASSVWMAAVLGTGCGFGYWMMVVPGFVAAILILVIGRYVEHAVLKLGGDVNPPPK